MEFVIQKACLHDLDELVKLEQISFAQESFSKRQLRYLLLKAKGIFVLSRIQGELAASMICLRKKNSKRIRIYSLVVSTNFRGLGLGKMLLKYAEEEAVAQSMAGVKLEVSENNQAAVKLYLNSGYHPVSEKKDYYKDGSRALVMQKDF